MSPDYAHWFLFNASPDIHAQMEAFPALRPGSDERTGRSLPFRSVLLTDAEIDHTLGLLLLREASAIELHATKEVHDTLYAGTSFLRVLEAYLRVEWQPVVPEADVPLADGLSYRAFDVPTTKRARFGSDAGQGRIVGYRLTDERSGRVLVYLPGVQELTAGLRGQLDDCTCLLVDGTCWRDDELIRLGVGGKMAREMGHVPIDGPGGSLEQLSKLPIERKIYTHINNTNPILLDDSPERAVVDERGMEVAADGLEVAL